MTWTMSEQITISAVEGNAQKLDGGAMFGNAPRALWERWASPDEQGRIPLACRSALIEVGKTKILLETGIGAFFAPKLAERFGVQQSDRHLLRENLAQLGVTPDAIDYVVLSHLHFDHAGGLLPPFAEIEKGNQGLLFPNATFIVGREAMERAETPHLRDRASFIGNLPAKLKATGKVVLVDSDKAPGVLEDRLSFRQSHGHTPGQMHTVFKGNQDTVFFAGDLIPGRNWVHLPITMGYDRYPEKVIDEKAELYKVAVPERWWMFYTHDPEVKMSRVSKNEGGKFEPVELQKSVERVPF